MPTNRSNDILRTFFRVTSLFGLIALVGSSAGALAHTQDTAPLSAPISAWGAVDLVAPIDQAVIDLSVEPVGVTDTVEESLEIAQYGSIRRVSRRTARRVSRRHR